MGIARHPGRSSRRERGWLSGVLLAAGMFAGLGFLALYLIACACNGFPNRTWEQWSGPVMGLLGTGCAMRLWRRHREEIKAFRGYWQFSILDIQVIVLFLAAQFAIGHAFFGDSPVLRLVSGVAMSLFFVIGMLLANRHGVSSTAVRHVYALAFAGRMFGGFILGVAGTIALLLCIDGIALWDVADKMLGITVERSQDMALYTLTRSSLVMFPAGWFGCSELIRRYGTTARVVAPTASLSA